MTDFYRAAHSEDEEAIRNCGGHFNKHTLRLHAMPSSPKKLQQYSWYWLCAHTTAMCTLLLCKRRYSITPF